MNTFKLPDLGEGLQDAEVIEWRVKEGDKVNVDQVIVIVETAKAIVELPSPVEGTIQKLCVREGGTAHVGQNLLEYSSAQSESVSVVGKLVTSVESEALEESFIIGAGSDNGEQVTNSVKVADRQAQRSSLSSGLSPDIVAFAQRLGLTDELTALPANQANKHTISQLYKSKIKSQGHDANVTEGDNPVFPLSGTKKLMAQAMSRSHQSVPSVTLFEDAHIGHWSGDDITIRGIQALVAACISTPILNAWFDEDAFAIQTFSDINVGVAVNSEQGLFVPVIRRAQAHDSLTLRKLVDKVVRDVQARSIKPQKLLGATISISNFGMLCGRYATPIIVPPQVAIIGLGKARKEPVVRHDKIVAETILPVSLSFDHRAATGAEAAKFLETFIAELQN